MEPALEALPARPLTAEGLAALNDAPALGVIPYSWYGDQVIALLLLYDERRADEEDAGTEAEQSVPDAAQQSAESESQQDESESQQTETEQTESESQQTEAEQTEAETQQTETEQTEAETQQTEVESQQMETEQQQTDDSSGREATSADASSGFGEDSPGVGTVEVIDSGDLTPQKEDDSLTPDLGGGSDSAQGDGSGEDETAESKDDSREENDPETNRTESTEDGNVGDAPAGDKAASEGPVEEKDASETPVDDDHTRQESTTEEPDGDSPEHEAPDLAGTDRDEAEALHVYAVGFDAGVDSWVAIAEIDPDAELTDAEPLFRDWATRTYHDQIVDRLAIGPSEYDLDE